MDEYTFFKHYVAEVGGRAEAAARLGVSVGMVGHIELGRRRVSIALAKRLETETGGRMSRHDLRPDIFGPASQGGQGHG